MRHLKAGRKLGRNATHRLALMRNLALALFRHERIITTVEKAKEAAAVRREADHAGQEGHAARPPAGHRPAGPAGQGGSQAATRTTKADDAHDHQQAVQRDRPALRRPAGRLHAHHQAARTPPRRRRQDRLPRAAQGRRDQGPSQGARPPPRRRASKRRPAPALPETPPAPAPEAGRRRRRRPQPRRRRRRQRLPTPPERLNRSRFGERPA